MLGSEGACDPLARDPVACALRQASEAGHLTVEQAHDLAQHTEALFGSLRQLHELMTGPHGKELSPKEVRGFSRSWVA